MYPPDPIDLNPTLLYSIEEIKKHYDLEITRPLASPFTNWLPSSHIYIIKNLYINITILLKLK